MGQNIVLTGMVLSAVPVGEYDKRITLLTRERGKISAFARGARRPGSQLMASGSPFSFGTFEVYEGRSSFTVVKTEISNYFRKLAENLDDACYGFYFLEIADYYARENTDEIHMLKLLYQSLRALEKESLENRLVRRIFELKALTINGEYPNVFSCMMCGREESLPWFHTKSGGVLCENCGKQAADARCLHPSALYAMQFIITSSVEKLYTFTLSQQALENLEKTMDEYMAFYVDKKFHALQILKEEKFFPEKISGCNPKQKRV